MSRAVRRELFSTLETLEKANKVLKKILVKSNPEAVIDLLTDCQNCAIAIGNRIEEVYGNDLGIIHVLEDYCEGVYQIAENINIAERAKKSYAEVRMQLMKVREAMEEDIPDKLEVVFFPYKASMWDSLESVYLAAKEDPDCDAYCVPIPYYDKNPDGSFGAMHYEGNEYPRNIEVTDWQDYDFEIRMPDVIYIHNPYDEWNHVTSVHPHFYAANLTQYTDELVYIPYFVLGEINPANRSTIDDMKHFCFLPGTMYADKVILQSENMCKIYINEYMKATGQPDNQELRQKLEKRFLGLGSPKFDKALNTKKEDLDIPKEWLKIIEKSDGSYKKIIFYNTSITALLKSDDKMLKKMEDVFRIFKKNKDEVALLWRPHPLIESTVSSMRPQLWEAYQQIKDRYIEEGWGIYDDTADVDRTIALSDAYYGDQSSVVLMYQKTGKPIMLQNIWVNFTTEVKAEDVPIWPSAFCVDGDDIWFVHGVLNVLMRYNMREKYTYVIGKIPDEIMLHGLLYKGVSKWKNKVFLIPFNARKIAVYDVVENAFEKIKIHNIQKYDGKSLFYKVYTKGKCLYCMPINYEAILKIDMESNHIQYIAVKTMPSTYFNDTVRIGDEIVAVYAYTNQCLIFDMKTDRVSYYQLGNQNRQFNNIANIGEQLYLFDKCTHSIVEISKNKYDEDKVFSNMACDAVQMTTLPSGVMLLDTGYEIQIVNGHGTIFREKEERFVRNESLYSEYMSGIENDNTENSDKEFYFSRNGYCMLQFENGVFEKEFVMLLKESEFYKLKELLANSIDAVCDENDLYSLETWEKRINARQNQEQKLRQNCGMKILQVMKNSVIKG